MRQTWHFLFYLWTFLLLIKTLDVCSLNDAFKNSVKWLANNMKMKSRHCCNVFVTYGAERIEPISKSTLIFLLFFFPPWNILKTQSITTIDLCWRNGCRYIKLLARFSCTHNIFAVKCRHLHFFSRSHPPSYMFMDHDQAQTMPI